MNIMIAVCICLQVIIIVLIAYTVYESNNKNKKITKQIIIALLVLVGFSILLFLLDMNDILTPFDKSKVINSERWFNYIKDMICMISSCLLSGYILIYITREQIIEDRKERKEELRRENIPILKYSNYITDKDVDYEYSFCLDKEDKNLYIYEFGIENIGLNHAKNIKINFMYNNKSEIYNLEDMNCFLIFKGEKIINRLSILYDKVKIKKISIEIEYQDLLDNKYKYNVELQINSKNDEIKSIDFKKGYYDKDF